MAVVLSHLGEFSWRHANLPGIADNDLRLSLVHGNWPADFNLSPGQGFEITKLAFVGGKYHAGERAVVIILAEIEKGIAALRREYLKHTSGDASCLPCQGGRIVDIDTAGGLSAGGSRRSEGRRGRASGPAAHQDPEAEYREHNSRQEYPLSSHRETFDEVAASSSRHVAA